MNAPLSAAMSISETIPIPHCFIFLADLISVMTLPPFAIMLFFNFSLHRSSLIRSVIRYYSHYELSCDGASAVMLLVIGSILVIA
jgi:hypothetical protein